ncbi:hypothetical protein DRO58_08040 [Candidatus Bathyarchaeota archaeon]|nr:MAG: hypothetical protein DRO58_08040 [Candidatus Bathyarchaeota archaeon]
MYEEVKKKLDERVSRGLFSLSVLSSLFLKTVIGMLEDLENNKISKKKFREAYDVIEYAAKRAMVESVDSLFEDFREVIETIS